MTQRRKAQVDMFFVDLDLARRLEMAQAWRGVHYANAQLALRPETHSTVEAVAGGFALYAGEGSPLNKAVGLGMYRPVTQADLDHVERFYRSRNAAPRVSVCPLADPSLIDLLKAGGYRLEMFYSVLFRSLAEDGRAGIPDASPHRGANHPGHARRGRPVDTHDRARIHRTRNSAAGRHGHPIAQLLRRERDLLPRLDRWSARWRRRHVYP